MRRRTGYFCALVIASIGLLGVSMSASAGTQTQGTSSLFDPVGDALDISGPGTTPPYLDIVGAAVTKQSGRFRFSLDLSAPLPSSPQLISGVSKLWWFWVLDTDPSTFPTGFPRAPGVAVPPEFTVVLQWDGVKYTAFVVDRRPTLTGGEPVLTPLEFSIRRAQVALFVDAAVLDNPANFGFRTYTRAWRSHPGTDGTDELDQAPDNFDYVPWTA